MTAESTTEAHPANEVSFVKTTLNDLRLVDSDFQAFTVRNSTLSDVRFKDCVFSNVIFEDCSLKEVSFCGLEWTNVRVSGLVLRDVGWDGIGLRNVCINNDQRLRRKRGTITIPIRDGTTTSLTRSCILTLPRSNALPTHSASHAASIAVVSKLPPNILRLPKTVLQNIVRHLFLARPIFIRDRDITSYPNTRQTQYSLTTAQGKTRFYTYHGVSTPSSTTKVSAHLDVPLSFLRVYSKLYAIAVRQLYAGCFTFATPQGCLAFLHDHQKPELAIPSLELKIGPGTSLLAWRKLFDVLIWECRELRELSLEVGEEFWHTAPWEQGAVSVFEWDRGRQGDLERKRKRSFLGEVARMPGSRLLAHDGTVRFLLRIEGADGEVKREELVKEMEASIRREMMEVGEVRGGTRSSGCCAVRVLERCCYWPEEARS